MWRSIVRTLSDNAVAMAGLLMPAAIVQTRAAVRRDESARRAGAANVPVLCVSPHRYSVSTSHKRLFLP
jgi:hypothetical protein